MFMTVCYGCLQSPPPHLIITLTFESPFLCFQSPTSSGFVFPNIVIWLKHF